MTSPNQDLTTPESLERDFRWRVSPSVRLLPEGIDRFRVFTPFLFDDGDHPAIVLRRDGARWVLSDEGHTYMRLADLTGAVPPGSILEVLSEYRLEDRNGELLFTVQDQRYGEALQHFVYALLRIMGQNPARSRWPRVR